TKSYQCHIFLNILIYNINKKKKIYSNIKEVLALIKKSLLFLSLIIILSGCAQASGKEPLLNHMGHLENASANPKWQQITQQANEPQTIYKDNKCKLQLRGDEGEYEGLKESINKIIAAAKEKDTTNRRLEMATARSLILDIYSL